MANSGRAGSTQRSGRVRGYDHLTGIVIGYIASMLTSIAILLTLLKNGW